MKSSARSALAIGASIAAVSAAVIAPAQPTAPPAPAPNVRLAAAVQPLQPGQNPPRLPALLRSSGWLEPSVVPTAVPGVPNVLAIPIAPGLADSIDNFYLSVEPWVQYGFEVATAALAWVPYVGFLSGLIMDGYFFGESIVASAVFNFTDFLRGDGGIIENLVDFGVDVGLAFVWLGLDTLNTFVPLPPCNCYPPRPPVQGPFLALDTVTSLMNPNQNVEKLTATFGTSGSAGAEVSEARVEQLDAAGEQPEAAPAKKTVRELAGELVDRFTGERAKGGEEQDVDSPERTNPNETIDSATVRAQGQIRQSLVAAPTGRSQGQGATSTRGGKLTETLTALASSLSPKKPSTNAGPADTSSTAAGDSGGNADATK
jgi:hypothetical protein